MDGSKPQLMGRQGGRENNDSHESLPTLTSPLLTARPYADISPVRGETQALWGRRKGSRAKRLGRRMPRAGRFDDACAILAAHALDSALEFSLGAGGGTLHTVGQVANRPAAAPWRASPPPQQPSVPSQRATTPRQPPLLLAAPALLLDGGQAEDRCGSQELDPRCVGLAPSDRQQSSELRRPPQNVVAHEATRLGAAP